MTYSKDKINYKKGGTTILLLFFLTHLNGQITFCFGSCSKSDHRQPLWEDISKLQPDAWIWLGDNIYGDTEDMDVLKEKYNRQNSIQDYKDLKTSIPVYGIWDDHDYGVNDGDRTYPFKDESKTIMLDWLGVPLDHPARDREGAYQDYIFTKNGLQVHLFLLDGRYFKDPLQRPDGVYLPDPNAQLLGESQWEWLEQNMQNSEADVFILASGIQFFAFQHRFEKWANHPADLSRLHKLLLKSRQPCILLSGDRHRGEIMLKNINGQKEVMEITSSSLTHSSQPNGEPNLFRKGPQVGQNHFGMLVIEQTNNGISVSAQLRSKGGKVESAYQRVYP